LIDQKVTNREILKFFGCSPEKILESLKEIYKMTWEQVLLLAVYSRQQFIEQEKNWSLPIESPKNFSNKIKLINILFHRTEQNYELLSDKVLEKIENYEDIHSITSFLMKIQESRDAQLSDLAKNLLNEISTNYISFTSKDSHNNKHPYSYYSMCKILNYSLPIFRDLIDLNLSIESVNETFLAAIKSTITGDRAIKTDYGFNDSPLHNFYKKIRESQSIEEIINIIIDNEEFKIDNNIISNGVYGIYSKYLGDWMNHIYCKLKKDKYSFNRNKNNTLNMIIKIDNENDEQNNRVIRINELNLQNILSLGMIDHLLNALKNRILKTNFIGNNFDPNSLNDVVNWYRKSKTILCPDIDDCPCLVASVLEFDFRNKIGTFDKDYGISIPINKKTWFAKDGYLIVTGLIRRFLFKSGSFENLYRLDKYYPDFLEDINEYINILYINNDKNFILNESLEDLKNLENNMMKVWANLTFSSPLDEKSKEYKALINRFKRLPIYLKEEKKVANAEDVSFRSKKNIWNLDGIIWRQKLNSQKIGYPIDSPFPFPLWANFDSVDKKRIRIFKIIEQVDTKLTVELPLKLT
jgi:hypothetical protein